MRKSIVFITMLLFMAVVSSQLFAGSSDMAESRIDELDKLNREAVRQIVGEPEKGTINLKVRAIPVKDGYKFEPLEKEATPSLPDTLLTKESDDKLFTFREGISRLTKNKPAITPYRHYGNEGEYISFKDAIIRLSRSSEK